MEAEAKKHGPSDAEIVALKAEHGEKFGELHEFYIEEIGKAVVCRLANRHEARRFTLQSANDEKREAAVHNLLTTCAVWPPRAELDAILEKHPMAATTWVGQLLKKMGLVPDGEVQKKVL